MPGFLQNVYCASAGGGKYLAILQIKKRKPNDEGMQRQAALVAFTAFSELKHVILVDDDVDIYDANDVMWAMTTRYQGDVDTIFIPGVRGHSLDPRPPPSSTSCCAARASPARPSSTARCPGDCRSASNARSSWTSIWRSTSRRRRARSAYRFTLVLTPPRATVI